MTLRVEGLDEWRRALRAVDATSEVKQANLALGQMVVGWAEERRRALAADYPLYRKVQIKPSKNQREVQVTVGPKEFGYQAEFGAYTHNVFGRRMLVWDMQRRVVPLWTGNQYSWGAGAVSDLTSGLMVLPSIAEHRTEIEDAYQQAMIDATSRAFPEG